MCVTVAMKLPRDIKTGKPTKDAKWRLAKIRDRMYDADYSVKRYTVKEHGASQLFLIDNETDWTEGVSVREDGFYLSMVNSALNNHSDKKDGKSKPAEVMPVSKNGKIIRQALKSKDIEVASKLIQENKFDGCTLLTDGDRLLIIETSLPVDVADEYRPMLKDGQRFEDIVPVEKFKTEVLEIKEDYLVVRTNSGVLDDSFGYQPKDGDGHESATKRREYAMSILEKNAFEPLDLIVEMSKMGRKEIDKNPFFRPLRLKEYCDIYTTSIIQTDPSGTMIVKPIECTFDIKNPQNLISPKFKTHLVILPHRSRMFETFKEYAERKFVEKLLS